MSLRPVDLQTSIVRAPDHPQPQARDAGAAAAQHVLGQHLKQEAARQQETVQAPPRPEGTAVSANPGRDSQGRQGGGSGRRRRAALPAPPGPREPGKGARLDFRC